MYGYTIVRCLFMFFHNTSIHFYNLNVHGNKTYITVFLGGWGGGCFYGLGMVVSVILKMTSNGTFHKISALIYLPSPTGYIQVGS